jgi:hypothetical protein
VNLGSRLEGTNKNYGTHIIVSESTYSASKHVVYGRWLDAVRVKGKREPINIYELMGRLEPGGLPPAHAKKLIDVFEAALRHYRAKQWVEAEFAFKEAIKLRNGNDPPSQVYLERILGLGYLDTQLKIQVHFLMLIITGSLFAVGVALFIWDFFRHAPTFQDAADRDLKPAPA